MKLLKLSLLFSLFLALSAFSYADIFLSLDNQGAFVDMSTNIAVEQNSIHLKEGENLFIHLPENQSMIEQLLRIKPFYALNEYLKPFESSILDLQTEPENLSEALYHDNLHFTAIHAGEDNITIYNTQRIPFTGGLSEASDLLATLHITVE